MELDWRQAEFFGNLCVLDLACFIQGFAHYKLSHKRGRGDSRSTTECLEFCLFDNTIFVNTNLELHDIPASVELGVG